MCVCVYVLYSRARERGVSYRARVCTRYKMSRVREREKEREKERNLLPLILHVVL